MDTFKAQNGGYTLVKKTSRHCPQRTHTWSSVRGLARVKKLCLWRHHNLRYSPPLKKGLQGAQLFTPNPS